MALFGNGIQTALRQLAPAGQPQPMPQQAIDPARLAAISGKKKGLFGNAFRPDSPLWHVMGGIGDVLTGEPVYTQGVQHRGMLRQKSLMDQAQAEAEDRQWYEREQWKKANKTNDPGSFEWYQGADPSQRATYERYKQGDPFMALNLPGNRIYAGPRSGLGQALGGGGGDIDNTPTVEDGHSYTPGPGGRANPANWKQAGGPASAPGGFPR